MVQASRSISNTKLVALLSGVAVLFWFGMHFPLVPATPQGWAAALGSLLIFVLCVILLVPALNWAEVRTTWQRMWRVLGAIAACSLGIGIFVAEYVWRDFITKNFTYL